VGVPARVDAQESAALGGLGGWDCPTGRAVLTVPVAATATLGLMDAGETLL